jgi:superfamily II DNA/RNA helicase
VHEVATDNAARGIDIDPITYTNFDLPNIPETYVRTPNM